MTFIICVNDRKEQSLLRRFTVKYHTNLILFVRVMCSKLWSWYSAMGILYIYISELFVVYVDVWKLYSS